MVLIVQEVQADSSSGRTDELQVYDSELNANVPEFYPSVLVPPLQWYANIDILFHLVITYN